MKVAWLYPLHERCGISLYSKEYVLALSPIIEIESFDILEVMRKPALFKERLNSCDALHIQYETSFFLKVKKDSFQNLTRLIKKPIIVSLHEVYQSFPGVFPRENIPGKGIVKTIREILYDWRHPYQTRYRLHCSHGFYATHLLTHYTFQKKILTHQDIDNQKIDTIPLPAQPRPSKPPMLDSKNKKIQLGTMGFINPNFDYKLLFASLTKLTHPWTFTWIGGIRREEDQHLLDSLQKRIADLGWEDCFVITGWVPQATLEKKLKKIDIYLALFKERSSSASLIRALSAGKLICATKLPLTEELVSQRKIMKVVNASPKSVVDTIEHLITDDNERQLIYNQASEYCKEHSISHCAEKLVDCYRSVLS